MKASIPDPSGTDVEYPLVGVSSSSAHTSRDETENKRSGRKRKRKKKDRIEKERTSQITEKVVN